MHKNCVPMWTKQTVAEKLYEDPLFKNLFDEGKGKYACDYAVNSIPIKVFFTTGGKVEIWLLSTPYLNSVAKDVQAFVTLAYEICDEIIKEGGRQ